MMLAALCLTCALFVSVSAPCTRSTSCLCGSSSKNYTLCVDYVPTKTDPCVRWNQCQTCQEGMSSCLSCPPGYYGPTCSEVTRLKMIRRKRQVSRSWSEATFQIGNCAPMSPPSSGLIRCHDASRRGRCRGKCKPGYTFQNHERESQIQLECRTNGWYPHTAFPPCVAGIIESDCPDPGTSSNLMRSPFARYYPDTFVAEETVTFSCSDSDEVLDGPSVITCMPDGTWSAPRPRCVVPEPQPCSFPGVDPNGQVFQRSAAEGFLDPNQMLPPGTRLIYSCNEGYLRFGPESITCLTSGDWSNYYPDCIQMLSTRPDPGVYCPDLGPISNGKYQSISRTRMKNGDVEYPLGSIVTYSCVLGYALQGSQELVCEDSGSWSESLPSCIEVCGKSTLEASRRITHGIKTLAGEWPWVVSISVSRGNYTNMICGGALIDRRTVLTAAHCLVSPERYYVLHFGKFYRIVSLDDDDVEVRRSTRTISHPDFDPVTYDNDIALIRFAPTISYSEKILPVCLPTPQSTANNLVPQHKGYVTGWGITEDDVQAYELMMAKLPVQSDATCTESYQRHNIDFQINPGMFCAGFPEGRTSTCRGDSGSPLVFYDEKMARYTVEGCVSFSVKGSCGREGRYTVFTKVGYYMPWIRKNS